MPIPLLAVAWVSFTLASSVSKPPVERAWIFFFPLSYGSAARFFPSILSLSLPGWLNELFSLLLALTFLCARPWASGCCWQGEWAGRSCPCREAGVGCAQHRKRLGTGELPALGSFSSLN